MRKALTNHKRAVDLNVNEFSVYTSGFANPDLLKIGISCGLDSSHQRQEAVHDVKMLSANSYGKLNLNWFSVLFLFWMVINYDEYR